MNIKKICASLLTLVLLAVHIPITESATLSIGTDTLSNSNTSQTSSHSIAFTTQTALDTGDQIQFYFDEFTLALDAANNVSVSTGPAATASYDNAEKTVTLTLSEQFNAGNIVVDIVDGKITSPATAGEYGISILTTDSSDGNAVLDTGLATAGISNAINAEINVIPLVGNITSTNEDNTYSPSDREVISITIAFNGKVSVSGTPELALNNTGTAYYVSGSGSSTLTFEYTTDPSGSYKEELDYMDANSLTLAGGSIGLPNGTAAILTLPEPGAENSLSYNKNIFVKYGRTLVVTPKFISFEIVDTAGETSDSTPPLKFEAESGAEKISLSCDGGATWSDWITYPTSGMLNVDTAEDFDILSCGSTEGLKTISIKASNSEGYESEILSDSTIFQQPVAASDPEPQDTTPSETPATVIEENTVTTTVDLSTATEEISSSEPASETEVKIVEIGYQSDLNTWKSVVSLKTDDLESISTQDVAVSEEYAEKVEVRVIEAENLASYTEAASGGTSESEETTTDAETPETSEPEVIEPVVKKIITKKAVLPSENGEIPIGVRLVSAESGLSQDTIALTDEAEEEALIATVDQKICVDIPAETNVISSSSNQSYEYVIHAPEVIENPPAITDENLEIEEAVFVGSSGESISFDQPVLLTLPATGRKNPQIHYFDEALGDWVISTDAKSGEAGGTLSEDGTHISIWVDHMTLFSVVDVKEITLIGIQRIAIGADVERRATFSSGEWFSPADIGNDDLVSFAWSGTGDKFYYALDQNPFPTSLQHTSDETFATANFYLDNIQIREGESYLHLRAEADGKRSEEAVFVINYDKTAPQITEVIAPEGAFTTGEDVELNISFSERITTADNFLIFFQSGEILEIPKIKSATTEITIPLTISKATSRDDLAIVSTLGMLVDRAGLVSINPRPLSSNLAAGKIRDATLELAYPAQQVEGKYFTKQDSVTITPRAVGATQMRLAANILGADAAWHDYSAQEIEIPLNDFGAQKILFEFTNAAGDSQSVGTVVTRLPVSSAEFSQLEADQITALEKLQKRIANQMQSLFSWGVATEYEDILASSNPAILPNSIVPTAEEIELLNNVLDTAQELRREIHTKEPSIKIITKLAQKIQEKNFTLDDFLTVTEINTLFAKLSEAEIDTLRDYFDLSVLSISQSTVGIRAGQLTLGMRDSDNDGLSDALEINLGSNPFVADSDRDEKDDGSEWLDLGTDPTKSDLSATARFVGLKDSVEDPRPLFRGLATAGEQVQLIATNAAGDNIVLGSATVNSDGIWLILADTVLPSGSYDLILKSGATELAAQKIKVDLDFILLPPNIHTGTSEVFTEHRPAFFGNTFYGSRVIGVFENLVTGEISSTAVVVDNTVGDFVIRPPRDLPIGEHRLIVYTELGDGTRSPVRTLDFEIAEKAKSAAFRFELLSQRGFIIGGTLVIVLIIGVIVRRRRK